MLLWPIAGAATLAGLTLLVLGLRGRRVDDHPVCRRCRFDLVGVEAARCPECGRDLADRNAVRIGNRRRRRAFIAVGSLALLLSITGAGAIGWAAANKFNWNTIKPVWLLTLETTGADAGRVEAALKELLARSARDELATAVLVDLARRGLDRQADMSARWVAQWGDIIEHAWLRQLLSEDEFQRYAAQAVLIWDPRDPASTPIDFRWSLDNPRPRENVRAGEQTSLMVSLGGRGASASRLFLRPTVERILINGEPIEPGHNSYSHHGLVGASGFTGMGSGSWTPESPGEHDVRITWTLRIFADDRPHTGAWSMATSTRNAPDGGESLPQSIQVRERTHIITITREHRMRVTVDPARVPHDVALFADPALADAVRDAVSLEFWDATPIAQGVLFRLSRAIDSPPVDIAFRVFLRVGDREWPSITISSRAGETSSSKMQIAANENGYADFTARTVDVILRPAPEIVELEEGYERIWGREVVIPNVPFKWAGDE